MIIDLGTMWENNRRLTVFNVFRSQCLLYKRIYCCLFVQQCVCDYNCNFVLARLRVCRWQIKYLYLLTYYTLIIRFQSKTNCYCFRQKSLTLHRPTLQLVLDVKHFSVYSLIRATEVCPPPVFSSHSYCRELCSVVSMFMSSQSSLYFTRPKKNIMNI